MEEVQYVRNYIIAQPYDLSHKAGAFIARMQFCCACPLVDRPDVKKAIIWGTQTGKIFLIWAKSNRPNSVCMLIQNR
jgi:hypothetical protein